MMRPSLRSQILDYGVPRFFLGILGYTIGWVWLFSPIIVFFL